MTIMGLLGHQDLKTTMIYLSDEMPPDIREKIERSQRRKTVA